MLMFSRSSFTAFCVCYRYCQRRCFSGPIILGLVPETLTSNSLALSVTSACCHLFLRSKWKLVQQDPELFTEFFRRQCLFACPRGCVSHFLAGQHNCSIAASCTSRKPEHWDVAPNQQESIISSMQPYSVPRITALLLLSCLRLIAWFIRVYILEMKRKWEEEL